MEGQIIYKDLSYRIVGLLFETHTKLGRYRNEKEYGDYFEGLLKKEGIKYIRECRVNLSLDDKIVCRNIYDFIIDAKIIVEFKTVDFLRKEYYFQIKRYLSSTGLKLGILVNFRDEYLRPKRIINNEI
jgi:GxxExxY protein